LTLGVVEVSGDSDYGVGDALAEVCLGVALELGKNARGNLLRRVLLVVNLLLPVGAHVALDRGNGAIDVSHSLALRGLTNEHFAVLGVGDDGGCGAKSLCVSNNGGLSTLENGHHRVGGS